YLGQAQAFRRDCVEDRFRDRRVDRRGLSGIGIGDQPHVIVAEDRHCADLEAAHHHSPVFGIEAQGSAGASEPPFCSSSIEMLSGERTKAMCPSRGGRLIVTPASISRWHVS